MTRVSRLRRTALRAAQHPANALALAVALAGTVALDNPLLLALYALGAGVSALALWNWGAFADVFAAEDAAARHEQARQRRDALVAGLRLQLKELQRYSGIRPLLEVYETLVRMREEILRMICDRHDVVVTNEAEITRLVDQLLETYLTLAGQHLAYLTLLTGIRVGVAPTLERPVTRLPRLQERLAAIDSERLRLTEGLQAGLEASPAREACAGQLRLLEQRRGLLAEAGQQNERILVLLEAVQTSFAAIHERLAAADLLPTDVAGFVETTAARCAETMRAMDLRAG